MECIIKFSLNFFTTCEDEALGLSNKCFNHKCAQEGTLQ
jgi:hypothetical protein